MVFVDFGRTNWVLTEKTRFVRFWPKKVVLVDFHWKSGFDRKNWFWSILARKSDLDRFWQKRLVSADFGPKTGFGRFLPKNSGLGRFGLEKVGFDQNKWSWSISAGKKWFWSILTEKKRVSLNFGRKNVILVDSGSFGVS